MNIAGDLVLSFVRKSGGIAKVRELRDTMKAIPDAERADFMRRCARTDEGARQLMACALLGLSVAIECERLSRAAPESTEVKQSAALARAPLRGLRRTGAARAPQRRHLALRLRGARVRRRWRAAGEHRDSER